MCACVCFYLVCVCMMGGLELQSDCPVLEVNPTAVPGGWDLLAVSLGMRRKGVNAHKHKHTHTLSVSNSD